MMDPDKLKDRGMMKWHGFFMPEHIKELQDMWIDDHKVQMPILDEYQIQEIEERIDYSMVYKLPVEFKLLIGGFEEKIFGLVINLDHLKKEFKVKGKNDLIEYVKFDEIIDVKVIDS